MTQKEKDLLLKDLYTRLPDGVLCYSKGEPHIQELIGYVPDVEHYDIKPYLRPIEGMTEEEKKEILNLLFKENANLFEINEQGVIEGKKCTNILKDGLNIVLFAPTTTSIYVEWLNKKMFDYRGLIPLGLALKAKEDMYK